MLPIHGVYVVSKPSSERDGIYKIGFTTRHVNERMREFERETGNYEKYRCHMFVYCDRPKWLESKLHTYFREQNVDKEWHEVSLETVETVAEEYARSRLGEDYCMVIRPSCIHDPSKDWDGDRIIPEGDYDELYEEYEEAKQEQVTSFHKGHSHCAKNMITMEKEYRSLLAKALWSNRKNQRRTKDLEYILKTLQED